MGKFEKRFGVIFAVIMFGSAFYAMYYNYQHRHHEVDCACAKQGE
jgi:hypothetical protein